MRPIWAAISLCAAGVSMSPLAAAQVSSPHAGVTLVDYGSTALVVANLCAAGVSVRATTYAERNRTAAAWGTAVDAEVAINADFFDFPGWSFVIGRARGASEDWPPGAQLKEIRSYWQFGLSFAGLEPNAAITPAASPWITDIVGGHNILISDGAGKGPLYDGDAVLYGAHRRTAIGISADRRFLYFFVSDQALNGDGIVGNMVVHAAAAGAPPIHWATNMDGGGSSQLYVKGLGSVIPSSRPVNNHLGIYAKGVGPAWNCSCVPETCNGADDDCDGLVDEDVVQQCGTDVGLCEFGTQKCAQGTWGECLGGIEPTLETCDELDNDCDGPTDEDEVCEIEEAWQAALYDSGTSSDLDGDGRADACGLTEVGIECRLSTGKGFGSALKGPNGSTKLDSPSVFSTLRTGDVTGDGRSDVCVREPDGVTCWAGTAHGLGKRITGPALSDAAGYDDPAYFSTIRLGDINGDGRIDLCARSPKGFSCYRATGNGFAQPKLLEALSDAAGFNDVNRYGTLRIGDVDGDSAADVCARGSDGMSCWLSKDGSFSERIVGPAWTDEAGWSKWERWSTIRLADMDGDGRADLCARDSDSFRCYLYDGVAFRREVVGPPLPEDTWSKRHRFGSLRIGDLNGDGASDVCARDGDRIACWLFTGNGFGQKVLGPTLTDADGWSRPEHYRTLRLADLDGDRGMDLCGRSRNGVECWLYRGGAFGKLIVGPAWSDDAGWAVASRYHTLRFAGAGMRALPGPSAGEDSESPLGSCGCRTARPGPRAGFFVLALGAFALAFLNRRLSSCCSRLH